MNSHTIDINEILTIQANRFPMLLIDRVTSVEAGHSAVCEKNFTYNEWFFPNHYPDDPNVPGFVLIESLVQSFLMTFLTLDEYKGSRTNFLDISDAKFRRKVVPGDKLRICSTLSSFKRGVARGRSDGFIGDEFACSGEFLVCIPEVMTVYRPQKNETQ